MKLNLILFSVLIAIGTFTYYYEELGKAEQKERADALSKLINPKELGQLKFMETENFSIVAKGEEFYTKKDGRLISKSHLSEVFNILGAIKVRRVISEGEVKSFKDFFPKDEFWFNFGFENGNIRYRLGHALSYSEDFYIEVQKDNVRTVAVAYDDSIKTGTYKKGERSLEKYNRLLALFYIKESMLVDRYVFQKRDFKLVKAETENIRNRPFKVDFKEIKTTPTILGEFSYEKSFFEKYAIQMRSLQGDQVFYPADESKLSKHVSTITLNDNIHLSLYQGYEDKLGYFLKATHRDVIFALSRKNAEIFFYNVQDFWDKSFKISKSIQFKLKKQTGKLKNKALIDLLNDQAFRLTTMKSKDLKKKIFDLSIDKHKYEVFHQSGELIVFNPKKLTALHYLVGKVLPFSVKYKELGE